MNMLDFSDLSETDKNKVVRVATKEAKTFIMSALKEHVGDIQLLKKEIAFRINCYKYIEIENMVYIIKDMVNLIHVE